MTKYVIGPDVALRLSQGLRTARPRPLDWTDGPQERPPTCAARRRAQPTGVFHPAKSRDTQRPHNAAARAFSKVRLFAALSAVNTFPDTPR